MEKFTKEIKELLEECMEEEDSTQYRNKMYREEEPSRYRYRGMGY